MTDGCTPQRTSGDRTYQIEIVGTSVGSFVEVYDSEHSDEEPAAFLPADDARGMANAILDALDGDSSE